MQGHKFIIAEPLSHSSYPWWYEDLVVKKLHLLPFSSFLLFASSSALFTILLYGWALSHHCFVLFVIWRCDSVIFKVYFAVHKLYYSHLFSFFFRMFSPVIFDSAIVFLNHLLLFCHIQRISLSLF